MTGTVAADVRWLRAAVVAAIAVLIGSLAHATAGGALPGPVVMVALTGMLTIVSAAALGRPATYRVLAALVAGGQLLVHGVLTAISGHPGHGTHPSAAPGAVPPPTPTGRSLDQLALATGTPAATPVPAGADVGTSLVHAWEHLREDLSGPNLLMALAHLGAAALVAAWLWSGEQALWALAALLGDRLVRHVHGLRSTWWRTDPRPALPGGLGVTRVPEGDVRRLRHLVSHGALGRRGPPGPASPAPSA